MHAPLKINKLTVGKTITLNINIIHILCFIKINDDTNHLNKYFTFLMAIICLYTSSEICACDNTVCVIFSFLVQVKSWASQVKSSSLDSIIGHLKETTSKSIDISNTNEKFEITHLSRECQRAQVLHSERPHWD